jgi:uncharacterized protein (TIGR02117 family)
MSKTTSLFYVVCLLLSGCSSTQTSCLSTPSEHTHTIYISNIGWHTGIVFPPQSHALKKIPEVTRYPADHYIEFGWGDRRYYRSTNPGFFDAARAGLFPSRSVIQISSFPEHPQRLFKDLEVIPLHMKPDSYETLVSFISSSFKRNDDSIVDSIGYGHYQNSNFYPAEGRFWFMNTCNTWISKALAMSSCGSVWIHPVTTGGLMRRIKNMLGNEM